MKYITLILNFIASLPLHDESFRIGYSFLLDYSVWKYWMLSVTAAQILLLLAWLEQVSFEIQVFNAVTLWQCICNFCLINCLVLLSKKKKKGMNSGHGSNVLFQSHYLSSRNHQTLWTQSVASSSLISSPMIWSASMNHQSVTLASLEANT